MSQVVKINCLFFFRCVVYRSDLLPITICKLEDAEAIYCEFLGTEVFKVPINNPGRLEKWPQLEALKEMQVIGTDTNFACNDIVLSNAGKKFAANDDLFCFTMRIRRLSYVRH